MKKRVMIASIFSGNAIRAAMLKFSPDELILVVEKDIEISNNEDIVRKRETLKKLQLEYKDILKINLLHVNSVFDLYDITKKIVEKIDSLDGSEISIHISEGTKPLAFGMSFASYLRKEKISGLYYISKDNKILRMPILSIPVNDSQKKLILLLNKNSMNTVLFRQKANMEKSVFYKYINELKIKGFIEESEGQLNVSEWGRIALLK